MTLPNNVARILDANFNRLREGLRVLEEHERFVLNHQASIDTLKQVRHDLRGWLQQQDSGLIQEFMLARDTKSDVLRDQLTPSESLRNNLDDVWMANMQRVKESLRVLEEYGKVVNAEWGAFFQKLRFEMYDFEKERMLR